MTTPMVPVIIETIPEALTAFLTTIPSPYAANGPAQRIANAKVFIVTMLTLPSAMSVATTAQTTLHSLV